MRTARRWSGVVVLGAAWTAGMHAPAPALAETLTIAPSSQPADMRPIIGSWPGERAKAQPLGLRAVKLGGFLGRHVDASNDSLLAGLQSPLPRGIEAVANGQTPPDESIRLATDSDFYKWLEGACYALAYDPSRTELRAAVDKYVQLILKLQRPDGYIGTGISPGFPFDEKVRHDLYVAGHLIEAGVAHHAATGERTLLDAAVRFADFYLKAFREEHPYFRLVGQEHPEIEVALVRLGRATGQERFIQFAVDLTRIAQLTPPLRNVRAGASRLHAVRLCYQLAGAAELFLQTGDADLGRVLTPLWDELVTTRTYVTGGIGYNEIVPDDPYDLPQTYDRKPSRDVAETCASVSLMMFGWRMNAISGASSDFDTIETILYNHCIGALAPDHCGNFYYNPLRRVGSLEGRTDHGGDPVRRTRLPAIHSTACCLPNAWRFFGALPEYVFSARPDGLLINLYTTARARHQLEDGRSVDVHVETDYPHRGEVRVRIEPQNEPAEFTLGLRIPGWCDEATVSVNDEPPADAMSGGYVELRRAWRAGDRVRLHLSMSPAVLVSRPEIEANRGQVAFRRGPLIYCLEQQDAPGLNLERAVVLLDGGNPAGSIGQAWDPSIPAHVLRVHVGHRRAVASQPAAYYPMPPSAPLDVRQVRLIPFYYRANREGVTRWLTWIPVQ